jgi:hypothetical protein
MWAFRVKPLDQPVYEVSLVEISAEKSDLEQPTQRVAGSRIELIRNRVQKPLEERTELSVCPSPVAPRVRIDRLFELALWHRETMFYEKSINFTLRCWQGDIDWERTPEHAPRHAKTIAL